MKIKIIKTFGHLKAGQEVDRTDATALKLIKLGHAVSLEDVKDNETFKELKTKKAK